MKQRILVTGSAGFIGRSMLPFLHGQGHIVAGLDIRTADVPNGVEFFHCDVLRREALLEVLRKFRPSVVIHLAARTDLDEHVGIDGYAANTVGVRNVVDAVKACGTVERVLFTSSQLVCEVGYVPKSDTDYCPVNLYGRSKVITEQVVREAMPDNIAWCILRPTTIWGEGTSPHYQRFLRLLRSGRYVHPGSAPLMKSYGYVGNAVYQYMKFMGAPVGQVDRRTFYIADYAPISLREWVDALSRELAGRPVRTMPVGLAHVLAAGGNALNRLGFSRFPFNSFRLNNILTEYRFDMSPTETVCGPLPYTMQEGVMRMGRWFKELAGR